MTWDVVFQTIVLIIGSLGGGSAIVLAITKWGAELLSAKIKADIESEHEKEMEEYRAQLSDSTAKLNMLLQNSLYITQHQYDLEMKIYKKAWNALYNLMTCKEWVKDFRTLNPNISNEYELKKQRNEQYKALTEKLEAYQKIIDSNAPFYQANAYIKFNEIVAEFQKICNVFYEYKDKIVMISQEDGEVLDEACSEIDNKKSLLTEILRQYLHSLKCISV